ncbi:hypothetical protein EUTSA_v10010890mg [Eutrema salsugineum]|uniref:Uncharacterized protein n=1 Tax=Eutrema salsugineum TaxID=72664 RepID=V4LTB7_EUTSA|nr:hypothetical protein EUTSA_v10010890mg [Eutrema salsugineum]
MSFPAVWFFCASSVLLIGVFCVSASSRSVVVSSKDFRTDASKSFPVRLINFVTKIILICGRLTYVL